MKNTITYLLVAMAALMLTSCFKDEPDSSSIFDSYEGAVKSEFDLWLDRHYVDPYNINFEYRMPDRETHFNYWVSPPPVDKSIQLAKLIKYVILDGMAELMSAEDDPLLLAKTYFPRQLFLVGCHEIESTGTVVLASAENGLQINLLGVNFFNCEVYGAEVSAGSLSFLPSVIVNQLGYNNAGLALDPGRAFVPLFLIESVINIAGYFIIAYLVPFVWRKYRPKGALCGLYMVWYGIVRMIMEPLRDPSFNMGADGNWSFWNSLGYILLGLAFIGIMYLLDYLGKRKKEEVKPQIEGETAQKQAEGEKEGE